MDELTFPPDRGAAPALDPTLTDLLLDGRLDRDAVPPAYAAVVDLLDAARVPGDDAELAGAAAAVAAFRAHHRPVSRRSLVLSRQLAVKTVVAAVGVLSVTGVAAAATGTLPSGPRPVLGAAVQAPDNGGAAADGTRAGTAGPAGDRTGRLALCEAASQGSAAEAAPAAAALSRLAGGADKVTVYCAAVVAEAPDGAQGPDGTGPAATGLCRAAAAGQDADRGGRDAAVAFQALVVAAGGADKVTAYCAATAAAAAGAPTGAAGAASGRPSRPAVPEPTRATGRPAAPPSATPSAGRHGDRP